LWDDTIINPLLLGDDLTLEHQELAAITVLRLLLPLMINSEFYLVILTAYNIFVEQKLLELIKLLSD